MTEPNPENENGGSGDSGSGSGSGNNIKISAVSPKLPPFWSANPEIWFAQVEANFTISGISADNTKYCHVLANIDSKLLSSVQDIVKNPPADNKYQALKTRLLKEYSSTETEKLNKLLQTMELGDRKPSQLLREMQNLAGDNFGPNAIETLFIQRLPEYMKHIISATKGDISEKANIADKIAEISRPQISSLSNNSSNNSELKNAVEKLTESINKLLKSDSRSRSKSRNRSYSRSRSKSKQSSDEEQVCFYHKKFGGEAKKCKPPCSFKGN